MASSSPSTPPSGLSRIRLKNGRTTDMDYLPFSKEDQEFLNSEQAKQQ